MKTIIQIDSVHCEEISDYSGGLQSKDELYFLVHGVQTPPPGTWAMAVAKKIPGSDNYIPIAEKQTLAGNALRDQNGAVVSPVLYEATFANPAKFSAMLFISLKDQELTEHEPLGNFNMRFDGANLGWKLDGVEPHLIKEATQPSPGVQHWKIGWMIYKANPFGHVTLESMYYLELTARTA